MCTVWSWCTSVACAPDFCFYKRRTKMIWGILKIALNHSFTTQLKIWCLFFTPNHWVESRTMDTQFGCHTATSQQQMALNFELVASDQLFSVVLASCKWFKISAPGVEMRHMWQLDIKRSFHCNVEPKIFFKIFLKFCHCLL